MSGGCRLHGLDVLSDLDLHTPRPMAGERPDVRVLLGTPIRSTREVPPGELAVQWSIPTGQRASFVRRDDGSHLLRFEETCDVVVDALASEVTVHLVDGVDEDMGAVLVAGTVLSYVLMLRGALVLHASAVEVGDRVIGFVGSSGMGKTTLATLLCRDGGRLVTDDVLHVSASDDGFYACHLGATEVRLRTAAAGLSDDFGAGAAHRSTADERRALTVPAATADGVRLGALLVPRPRRDTTELTLTPVPAAAAALALLSFPRILGVRDQRLLAGQFAQMSELARHVPVLVADVPWGPPFPTDLSPRLLAALEETVTVDAQALSQQEAPC
ncbi:MAG: hypothetical protein ACI379_12330 [Nocardioides sp.]|uniref:hypothetical protein n=1 Tax=Nocardioides sp. TaxID=35761 RepID=UPI003F0E4962